MVISDNSALSALAESELLHLLPSLFGEVFIPEAVRSECNHPNAPVLLREWISNPPGWIHIASDPDCLLPQTQGLGAGEAAAITLAWNNRATSKLILDEKRGRHVAQALGLPMTGVLGIIGTAAKLGWLEFEDALLRLEEVGFHMSDDVVAAVRRRLQS